MTGEEIERAIEFLLKNQATLEGQLAETNRIIRMHADTQTEFIQIVTKAISDLAESQRRADTRIAEVDERAARRHAEIDARIAEVDERAAQRHAEIDARIAEVEERNARRHDNIDARLDRLVGVVERLAEARGTE